MKSDGWLQACDLTLRSWKAKTQSVANQFKSIARYSLSAMAGAVLAGCSSANAQDRPVMDPMLTALEFFQPTPKAYSIESECGGSPFVMRWTFDGRSSVLTHLSFGEPGIVENGELLNDAMGEIGGDIYVRSNCGPEGVEIRASEAWPRSSRSRQVLFNITGGGLREISRYGFD